MYILPLAGTAAILMNIAGLLFCLVATRLLGPKVTPPSVDCEIQILGGLQSEAPLVPVSTVCQETYTVLPDPVAICAP